MANVNDVVLLYLEDRPVSFARVEDIRPDFKKDWYQIKLLMLQIPMQVVTWILKEEYINGEPFNMGGKKMKLEKVLCPADENPVAEPETRTDQKNTNIISFADLKKNHGPESG
ncbi:MAG: hypothetical protein KKE62_04100 [Proteobacteria bacterium]|nr:hypothetical protein [Pseudomonadota bacterium]MBU1387942.1 hypothetical protein [Pseudomonadota bacterium]MBU1542005.1 hypothetical protein [Pseudomonadota bacterium]MBU2430570.1 hypothetical protein [Pseudomonadota bacterium]